MTRRWQCTPIICINGRSLNLAVPLCTNNLRWRTIVEFCRDRVDGNSNENGASTIDDYRRDVHEDKVNDMIDGGLEALLDLRNNEFEEEGMVDENNDDKCDENDDDYFYNQV